MKEFVIWVLITFFGLAISLVILMYLQSKKGFLKKEKERKASDNDPLYGLKRKILKVFTNGPMGFSELCITVDSSCKKIAMALKEMEAVDVVGKRKPIEDNPEFQMWGIARPDFSKLWAKFKKWFKKNPRRSSC